MLIDDADFWVRIRLHDFLVLVLVIFFVLFFATYIFFITHIMHTCFHSVRLIETPVEVDGVMYEPLDPDYEELIARAISKPMPIPTSPNSPKRRYAARRLRVSPITSARGGEVDPEDSDDKDFDDDFDEGVFHMSLPADHIPLDPNTPYISMMPGNRKRLFESMGVPAV